MTSEERQIEAWRFRLDAAAERIERIERMIKAIEEEEAVYGPY